jgi:hypothetical protein
MNNWNEAELKFRYERLSVRLERLAENFLRLASLVQNEQNSEVALGVIQESKMFLELTAIDLDVDRAFELAQIQRQLSRWHLHWVETWENHSTRLEMRLSPNFGQFGCANWRACWFETWVCLQVIHTCHFSRICR